VRRAVLLSAAVAVAVAGCGAGGDDGGDAATEAMVLETCAPGQDDPIEVEVCECAFDELRERFDAEALEDLDRQLRDEPDTVPAAVREVVLDCAFGRVAPPTTKQPTTTSSASSTTTSQP
jgi:hypothetical protein